MPTLLPHSELLGLFILSIVRNSKYYKKQCFGIRNLFPTSREDWKTLSLLSPLEGPNLSHWTGLDWSGLAKGPKRVSPLFHVRTETDPVSETLCFLIFSIVDDGQSSQTQLF
jgi:hypothetical protein